MQKCIAGNAFKTEQYEKYKFILSYYCYVKNT